MTAINLSNALNALRNQGVIAYPTESVFGLGCDPDCRQAIEKVLQIKKRPAYKGLILIAADIAQLQNYADFSSLNSTQLSAIKESWPGPVTWVIAAQKNLSPLISGDFDSVAVRVSDHPVVQQLCREFCKPLISTSANLSGLPPCTTSRQVRSMFSRQALLESIVDAPVSGLSAPSQIYNGYSGKRLR